MVYKKKYLPFLLGGGLLLLFLLTRLYNILSLPIFTDEAIYVRWTQYLQTDWKFWDYSITDGKQPMFVWWAFPLMKLTSDPLLAGRLVSVFAGLFSMVGMYFLTSETFKNPSAPLRARKLGLLAGFVYVLYPFALMYDRLALYDSLVAMFMIWSLYFEVLLIRRMKLKYAVILGMIMGGGMLTKTSANFAFYLLPFSLLLFNFRDKKWKKKLIAWVMYAALATLIANSLYQILRLSPYFHIIGQKNTTFVYPLSEWLLHPFTYVWNNLRGLTGWLTGYMTAPFLILAAASFLVSKKFIREKLLLLVWFMAPFTGLAVFGKVIYPRFILFMTMPLLALGVYTLFHATEAVKRVWVKALVVAVFLASFVVNDFLIISSFEKARIPLAERQQFIIGWPSGVGVKETVAFIEKEAKEKKIFVGTEGTFGLMPYALEIYVKDNPNVTVKGYWPIGAKPPQEVTNAAQKMPTYFVFYQPCSSCAHPGLAPELWPLKEVLRFNRIEKDSYYTLYQVLPQ